VNYYLKENILHQLSAYKITKYMFLREELKMEKKVDSKFIGAMVFTLMFFIIGIKDLNTGKNGYWISFVISAVSLVFFIYLLKHTKKTPNERYSDERKELISLKSESMSFSLLFSVIIILEILVKSNKLILDSGMLLLILMGSALIINLVCYLICRSKY
jgi:hypothetical protein